MGELAGRHPSTIAYWLKRHGLKAAHSDANAPRGGLARERLEPLVIQGLSAPAIAAEVDRSVATVRYWLDRHGLATHRAVRTRAYAQGRLSGAAELEMTCPRHGTTTSFRLGANGQYRCRRCSSETVAERRRTVKATLVAEAGGRCRLCGYDRYAGALEFHHMDRAQKLFSIGHEGNTRAIDRLREEARKCALVCANCHAEIEAGVATLPFDGAFRGLRSR